MIRVLTIVSDTNADERLYINGRSWNYRGDGTVYACDIAHATEGNPVKVDFQTINHVWPEWPDTLSECLSCQVEEE